MVVLALIGTGSATTTSTGMPSSCEDPEWIALGEGHRSGESAPDGSSTAAVPRPRRPTIEELAGLAPADYLVGGSLRDSLTNVTPSTPGTDYVFMVHTWARTSRGDPDRSFFGSARGQIPDHVAARSRTGLLIRSDLNRDVDRERYAYESYCCRRVGWERQNQFADRRHRAEVAELRDRLDRFDACRRVSRAEAWTQQCAAVRFRWAATTTVCMCRRRMWSSSTTTTPTPGTWCT